MSYVKCFTFIRKLLLTGAVAAAGTVAIQNLIIAKKKADMKKMERSIRQPIVDLEDTEDGIDFEDVKECEPMTKKEYAKEIVTEFKKEMSDDFHDICKNSLAWIDKHNLWCIGAGIGLLMADEAYEEKMNNIKKSIDFAKGAKDITKTMAAHYADVTDNGKEVGYEEGIMMFRTATGIDVHQLRNVHRDTDGNWAMKGDVVGKIKSV